MIKKIVLFNFLAIISLGLSAQSMGEITPNESGLAIILTLIVAVAALVLSVVNTFRISHNKKIAEVDLVNQKDDLNVTMEAVKVALSKDLRYLRKEFGKTQRDSRPREAQNSNQSKNSTEEATDEVKNVEKKPYKRKSNYKRRPPHKKVADNNNEKNNDPKE